MADKDRDLVAELDFWLITSPFPIVIKARDEIVALRKTLEETIYEKKKYQDANS
jgi:hypothetical protein